MQGAIHGDGKATTEEVKVFQQNLWQRLQQNMNTRGHHVLGHDLPHGSHRLGGGRDRETARALRPLVWRRRLPALIITCTMVLVGIPTVAHFSSPAKADTTDPYTVMTVANQTDGTGFGSTSQTFVTSANGFIPGDDSPTDRVVSSRDTVTALVALYFNPANHRSVTVKPFNISHYLSDSNYPDCPSTLGIIGTANQDGSCTYDIPAGATGTIRQPITLTARDTHGTVQKNQSFSIGVWGGTEANGQPAYSTDADPITVVSAPMADLVAHHDESVNYIDPDNPDSALTLPFTGTFQVTEEQLYRAGYSRTKGITASVPYTAQIDVSAFPIGTVFKVNGNSTTFTSSSTHQLLPITSETKSSGKTMTEVSYTIPALLSSNTSQPWTAEEKKTGGQRLYPYHVISVEGNLSASGSDAFLNNGTGHQPGDGLDQNVSTADAQTGAQAGDTYPNNDWSAVTITLMPKPQKQVFSKQLTVPTVSSQTAFDPANISFVAGTSRWMKLAFSYRGAAPGTHVHAMLQIEAAEAAKKEKNSRVGQKRVLADTWYASEQKFDVSDPDGITVTGTTTPYVVQWSPDVRDSNDAADPNSTGWFTGTPTQQAQSVRVVFTPAADQTAFPDKGRIDVVIPMVINNPFDRNAADENPSIPDSDASDQGRYGYTLLDENGKIQQKDVADTEQITVLDTYHRRWDISSSVSGILTDSEGVQHSLWNDAYNRDQNTENVSHRLATLGSVLTYNFAPHVTGVLHRGDQLNPTVVAQVDACLSDVALTPGSAWTIESRTAGVCGSSDHPMTQVRLKLAHPVSAVVNFNGDASVPDINLRGRITLKTTKQALDGSAYVEPENYMADAAQETSPRSADTSITVRMRSGEQSANRISVLTGQVERDEPISWQVQFYDRSVTLLPAGSTRSTIVHLPANGDTSLKDPHWGTSGTNRYPNGSSNFRGTYQLTTFKLDQRDTTDGTRVFAGVPRDASKPATLADSDFTWTELAVDQNTGVVDLSALPAGVVPSALKFVTPADSAVATSTATITITPSGNGLDASHPTGQYNLWASPSSFSAGQAPADMQVSPWSWDATIVASTISGKVWWDNNDDSQITMGANPEKGIASVPVSLYRSADTNVDATTGEVTLKAGSAPVATTTTAADGSYSFKYLHSGQYVTAMSRTKKGADGKTVAVIPDRITSYYGASLPVEQSYAYANRVTGKATSVSTVIDLHKNDQMGYRNVNFGFYAPDPKVTVSQVPTGAANCENQSCSVSWDVTVTNKGNTSIPRGQAKLFARLSNNISLTSVNGLTDDTVIYGQGHFGQLLSLTGGESGMGASLLPHISGQTYSFGGEQASHLSPISLPGSSSFPDGNAFGRLYSFKGHLYAVSSASAGQQPATEITVDGQSVNAPNGIDQRYTNSSGQQTAWILFHKDNKLYVALPGYSSTQTTEATFVASGPEGSRTPENTGFGIIAVGGNLMSDSQRGQVAVWNHIAYIVDSSGMVRVLSSKGLPPDVVVPDSLHGSAWPTSDMNDMTAVAFVHSGVMYVHPLISDGGSSPDPGWLHVALPSGLTLPNDFALSSVPAAFSKDGKLYGVSVSGTTNRDTGEVTYSADIQQITDFQQNGRTVVGGLTSVRCPDGIRDTSLSSSGSSTPKYGEIFSVDGFLYRISMDKPLDAEGNPALYRSPRVEKVVFDTASPSIPIPDGILQNRDVDASPIFFVRSGTLYVIKPVAPLGDYDNWDDTRKWSLRAVPKAASASDLELSDSLNTQLLTQSGPYVFATGGSLYEVTWPDGADGSDVSQYQIEKVPLEVGSGDWALPIADDLSYTLDLSTQLNGRAAIIWSGGKIYAAVLGSVKMLGADQNDDLSQPGIHRLTVPGEGPMRAAELSRDPSSPWNGKQSIDENGYTTHAFRIDRTLAPGQSLSFRIRGTVPQKWDATATNPSGGLGLGFQQQAISQVWVDYSSQSAEEGFHPATNQAFMPRSGVPDSSSAMGSDTAGIPAAPLADYVDSAQTAAHTRYTNVVDHIFNGTNSSSSDYSPAKDLVGDSKSQTVHAASPSSAPATSCRVDSDYVGESATLQIGWKAGVGPITRPAPADWSPASDRPARTGILGTLDGNAHTFGQRDLTSPTWAYRSTPSSGMREDSCYQSPLPIPAAEQAVILGTIAGHAWLDLNDNGVQDADNPGEKNLPGITVNLFQTDANGNITGTPVQTAVTGTDGSYTFTNLPLVKQDSDGSSSDITYRVLFARPQGDESTHTLYAFARQSADDRGTVATNSDIDPATGQSQTWNLNTLAADTPSHTPAHQVLHVDAGFQQFGPAIAVSKFVDTNNDWSDDSADAVRNHAEHDVTADPDRSRGKSGTSPQTQDIRLVVTNTGDEPLESVTLTDNTSGAPAAVWTSPSCTVVDANGHAVPSAECAVSATARTVLNVTGPAGTNLDLAPKQSIRISGGTVSMQSGQRHADTITVRARGTRTGSAVTASDGLTVRAPVFLGVTKTDPVSGDRLAGGHFTLARCTNSTCETTENASQNVVTADAENADQPGVTGTVATLWGTQKTTTSTEPLYWKLTETNSPTGYLRSAGWWKITVMGNPASSQIGDFTARVEAHDGAETGSIRLLRGSDQHVLGGVLTVSDPPSVAITKKGLFNGKLLSGAKFRLCLAQNGQNIADTSSGSCTNVTSDEEGVLPIHSLPVPASAPAGGVVGRTWILTETDAPKGYVTSTTDYALKLTSTGWQLTALNTKDGSPSAQDWTRTIDATGTLPTGRPVSSSCRTSAAGAGKATCEISDPESLSQLPQTGGKPAWWAIVLIALTVLALGAAGVALLVRQKMRERA